MIRKSLYSVHNELTSGQSRFTVEVNPAAVMAGGECRFALSVVCLGPELANGDEPIAMSLVCDGDSQQLESLHHQAEPSGPGGHLTVALFAASRDLLQRLAISTDVEIRLACEEHDLVHRLGVENRRNVASFLGHPDVMSSRTRPDPPTVESVAV